MFLTHSEAKQYQTFRSLEQRKPYFRSKQGERTNKKTWAPRKLSAKPFSREAEEVAWLLLGSETLFLRSGHGQVMMFLQSKCYAQFWQDRVRSQGTTFYLPGPGPGEEEGSWAGRLSFSGSGGHPSSTQSASSHQCTALAEEAGLSWQQLQSQVPDPTQPTKLLLLQGWMLVSGKKYLDLDQVERDFCSARQAYAHAQQEEVIEERDLHPNYQEVTWVWSLSGRSC